jgi:hypothetical protein
VRGKAKGDLWKRRDTHLLSRRRLRSGPAERAMMLPGKQAEIPSHLNLSVGRKFRRKFPGLTDPILILGCAALSRNRSDGRGVLIFMSVFACFAWG